MFLPDKSFTYISDAWHTTSWLDHCVCTADAHASLDNIEIYYEMATSDHIPIVISLNGENLPMLAVVDHEVNTGKLDWSNLTKEEINRYTAVTENLLNNIKLPILGLPGNEWSRRASPRLPLHYKYNPTLKPQSYLQSSEFDIYFLFYTISY